MNYFPTLRDWGRYRLFPSEQRVPTLERLRSSVQTVCYQCEMPVYPLQEYRSPCYYYYYYFGIRCARPGESEDTLSVQRHQPHTTNPWKEVKDKTVGDKKERADHANRKALALLLKPASRAVTSAATSSARY